MCDLMGASTLLRHDHVMIEFLANFKELEHMLDKVKSFT